jgi:uncharacterized membrane protein
MLPRLLTIWEHVRTSLWALPLAMIAVAAVIALVAVGIPIRTGGDPVWFLYSGEAKDAPGFLSNLVTATITLATLAISITMVVLTLAAQQLGPRLIRIFMSNLRTQAMLGLFVATVVYLLLVMRSIYGDTVPNLAVTIGTALVLLSTITLLVFVHHLARSIIADDVIQNVGAEIDGSVRRLLPDKSESQSAGTQRPNGAADDLRLSCEGYIQALDHSKLVDAARDHNCVIELDVRAGHLLIPGLVVGKVWPAKAGVKAGVPELTKSIEAGFIVGRDRTPVQDIEFSIRQMVEVGVRALSPGVNDPYTALVTIDRLSLSLAHAMARGDARREWCDGDGTLRLIAQTSTLSGLLDAGYNMLRQYGEGSPAVLIRLAERLGDLHELGDDAQRKHIARHLEMVLRAGRRTLPEPNDLAVLENRIPQAARVTSAAG